MPTGASLSEQHWEYVRGVLQAHGERPEVIEKCGWHYRSAFDHGYKHGCQDALRQMVERR